MTSNTCTFSVTVVKPQVDLGITKTANTNNVKAGQQLTFNLTLTNAGPNTLSNAIVVSEALPTGLQYVSDTGGGAYNFGAGQWTVVPGPLGGSSSLGITVLATNAGTYTNTVVINVPPWVIDPNTANNTASAAVTVGPSVTINAPVITKITYLGTTVRLFFTTQTGVSYTVQQRTDLKTGQWASVGSALSGTGSVISTDITVSSPTRQFYRISAQ